MKILSKPKTVTLALAALAAGVALLACVFAPRAVTSHAYYYYGVRLTGGNVHVDWNSSEADMRYSDLSPTDLDNYLQRVYLEINNGYSVNGCDELTAYTRLSTVSLYYRFTKNNDGIDKSWISTRNHRLTLYDANDSEVVSSSGGGASQNDADCYLENTYNALPEGRYKIEAYFWQGHGVHSTQFQNRFYYTQYLVVDRTPPTLTRSAEYARDSASATFSDARSPVTAVYSHNGGAASSYTSGRALTAEGRYVVTATDAAGNTASTSFTVDRTPPSLRVSSEVSRTRLEVDFPAAGANESPVTVTYSRDGVDCGALDSGAVFSDEGRYVFTATDAAGNVTAVTAVVDRTAPVIRFSADGAAVSDYTAVPFVADAEDSLSGLTSIELYESGRYVPYDRALRSDNGLYMFRAVDRAGNTAEARLVVYRTDTFGNAAAIRDGYKLNARFTVILPARIFTTPSKDDSGRYSFESYDKALEFAAAKEREYRVTPVQGGNMYVSATNEAIAQKYTDEKTLAAVVEKYAKGYISARQVMSESGSDKPNVEPESLTRNSPTLPSFLGDYAALPRYFMRASVTWSLPDVPYIKGMPYTVTALYLGDVAAVLGHAEFTVPAGVTLSDAARDNGGYRQGFYLVSERDAAGNIERYLVYSDAEAPTLFVTAAFGDGDAELTLDLEYTRNETLYFLSLALERLLDNADPYITLKIQKGNTAEYFTQSDALPVLGEGTYTSGKYTVTVYDRSLNALGFDVYIAGAPPTMTHGSLAADKADCRISFVTSDRYNVITSLALYKLEYDGTKTVLDVDGAGVPVSAATLTYTLTDGGKYGATLKDNYRRTVDVPPIFFLKGLPSGRLSGVKDGGRTNRNVAFAFYPADVCEIFTLHPNGERRPFTDYSVQSGAAQTTYNIAAGDATSHEYLVFLHNAADKSLYVEYTFEIDTVLPFFEITDTSGNVVEPDGATNKPFSIEWNETGVSVRYTTAHGGGLSSLRYDPGTVLSLGTLYYFTLKDDVGNTLEFTVLLDNSVDYDIGGKYNAVDGVLYACSPLTFTVNEPTARFEVVNADGYGIDNGGTLTQAGRYTITVEDNYGNVLVLEIVMDFTPPTLVLEGVGASGAANGRVVVVASDYDRLYLADGRGNKLKDIQSGVVFSDAGRYYVVASDYAGNVVTATFGIDLSVDFVLSVPNGAVTTEVVTLTADEPLEIVAKKDGAVIAAHTRFAEPGSYMLELTDALGNTAVAAFVIVPARVRQLDVGLPFGTGIVSVTKDGKGLAVTDRSRLVLDASGAYVVALDCGGVASELRLELDNSPPAVTLVKDGDTVKLADADSDGLTFELTVGGRSVGCGVGKSFEAPGHYVLVVTDALGNTAVYEWDIPFRLNAWAIVAIFVGMLLLVTVLVLIVSARRRPRLN